jgi:hypothetical protein
MSEYTHIIVIFLFVWPRPKLASFMDQFLIDMVSESAKKVRTLSWNLVAGDKQESNLGNYIGRCCRCCCNS